MFFLISNWVNSEVIQVSPKYCDHGINSPFDNDFAVFIFCDDAQGTQIGVILQRPGVGPVAEKGTWSTNNRFWQEGLAMVDVHQIAWSTSGKFLYVATSEIYSDNSLYQLDLVNREITKLINGPELNVRASMDNMTDKQLFANGFVFDVNK